MSITPLPEPGKVAYMAELVADAVAKGARVINQGGGTAAGTLYYPAVVYPVIEGMKLYREEQFGPVVPVMPFQDIETALEYVITSEHGQQVSIFSADPDRSGAWSIRWSTRSAGSTSIANASVVPMYSRSPGAKTRPRARCR